METNSRGKKIIEDYATLSEDALHFIESRVSNALTVPANPNQFSALVSFASDVGPHMFQKSLLLKYFNAGEWRKASLEFNKWTIIGDKPSAALKKRRKKERTLFLMPYLAVEKK